MVVPNGQKIWKLKPREVQCPASRWCALTRTGGPIVLPQLKTSIKLGVVVHTCNPSHSGGRGRRITSLDKDGETLSQKQNKNKRAAMYLRW
jgi:hypothetical protein